MASNGSGPPLVRAAHWLSHVEYDPQSPVWKPWLTELSKLHTYVCYDQRGCGLSDRDVKKFDIESLVGDLEAVADQLGLNRFPLIGMSQGGAIAVAFAARHPERVSKLVLLGAYARGVLNRDNASERRIEAETLINLIRLGWGQDNPAFRQVFTSQYIPGGGVEQIRWWNDLQRKAAAPETAACILEAFHKIDVTRLALQLQVPTLVMHARGDARVPFEEGRFLASLIPGARFMALESNNHVLLEGEPAWLDFLSELKAFLGVNPEIKGECQERLNVLTASELAVLEQVAQGLDNQSIANVLNKSEKTVRNQISGIFSKLNVHSRAEVIVLARTLGLGIRNE